LKHSEGVSGDTAERAASTSRRSWWKRPIAWFAGIVGAAMTATAVAYLSGLLQEAVHQIGETGTPVSVDRVVEFRNGALGSSVVFARGRPFTDANLASLIRIDQNNGPSQVEWLESLGGVAPQTVYIELALRGNRTNAVRVTNINIVPECSSPLDGLLFLNPPQGADNSIVIHFDLDKPNPVAVVGKALSTSHDGSDPYFPARTISLKENEQQVVIVSASTEKQYCRFFLDMTILDGDKSSTQRIGMPNGSGFEVTGWVALKQYKSVYHHLCPSGWRKASKAFISADGNLDDYCQG